MYQYFFYNCSVGTRSLNKSLGIILKFSFVLGKKYAFEISGSQSLGPGIDVEVLRWSQINQSTLFVAAGKFDYSKSKQMERKHMFSTHKIKGIGINRKNIVLLGV